MVQAEIAQAVSQKNATSLDAIKAEKNIEMQKSQLRSEPNFTTYEKDIDGYLSRMDLQSKLNPDSVRTLYWMMVGKNQKQQVETANQEAQLKKTVIEKQNRRHR